MVKCRNIVTVSTIIIYIHIHVDEINEISILHPIRPLVLFFYYFSKK